MRTIGAGALLSTTPALTSGRSKNGRRQFVGISYDTDTHLSQDSARGWIKESEDSLQGILHIGGYTIPLGEDTSWKVDGKLRSCRIEL